MTSTTPPPGSGGVTEEHLQRAMTQAVAYCIDHVTRGGLPFVGILVLPDGTLTRPGTNEVARTGDPSAHAEVQAIRAAALQHGEHALHGAVLLATGEPCTMCYQFAADHGITHVRYAVSADEAARRGFDYRRPHTSTAARRLADAATRLRVPEALTPFTTRSRATTPTSPF